MLRWSRRTRFRRLIGSIISAQEAWALFFLTPFLVVFVLFVVYPVGYALYLGTDLSVYGRVLADPLYLQSLWNTFVFILLGVGLKMLLALGLSSLLVLPGRGMRVVNVLFILPWVVPQIPSIFSIRWMLNSEWGMINNLLFAMFRIDGPAWLSDPRYAMGSIIALHIWKYLPFWTMIIVAARMAIRAGPLRGGADRRGVILRPVSLCDVSVHRNRLRHQHYAFGHLVAGRLQQYLPSDGRRADGPHQYAGDTGHPLRLQPGRFTRRRGHHDIGPASASAAYHRPDATAGEAGQCIT